MVYIYLDNGEVKMTRGEMPDGVPVISLERMIPEPVKEGCKAVLRADFDSQTAWFELVETLDGAKARKKAEILAYDSSAAVNEFTLGGLSLWLSREERASLKIRFEAEKAAGMTETVLWYGGHRIPIDNIDNGLGMLIRLELYASASYDRTQQHLAAVNALQSIEDIDAYDYTTDYPEKVEL